MSTEATHQALRALASQTVDRQRPGGVRCTAGRCLCALCGTVGKGTPHPWAERSKRERAA